MTAAEPHEQLDRAQMLAGIQRGLDAADAGRTRPAREVLESLRQKHKVPPVNCRRLRGQNPKCCLTLLCCIVVASGLRVSAQTTQSATTQKHADPNVLTERVLDAKSSIVDRVGAFQSLMSLPIPDRTPSLMTIALSNDEDWAAPAFMELVRQGEPAMGKKIAGAFAKWSPPIQNSSLWASGAFSKKAVAADPSLLIPVRQLLATPNKWPPRRKGEIRDVVDSATYVLARSGNHAEDVKLLQTVADARPESTGVWLSLAMANGVDDARLAVAKRVYKDAQGEPRVRLAAAIAAACAKDQDAEAFALGAIRASPAVGGSGCRDDHRRRAQGRRRGEGVSCAMR